MPFGLDKQILTITPRDERDVPTLWIAKVETALLGRAQIERGEHRLQLTMFGRPEVVAERVRRALSSALGDGCEALFEIRREPALRSGSAIP
jgi:hypothetical protein